MSDRAKWQQLTDSRPPGTLIQAGEWHEWEIIPYFMWLRGERVRIGEANVDRCLAIKPDPGGDVALYERMPR